MSSFDLAILKRIDSVKGKSAVIPHKPTIEELQKKKAKEMSVSSEEMDSEEE